MSKTVFFLSMVVILFVSSCSSEEKAYEEAAKDKSIVAYEKFLSSYPTGSFAIEVKKQIGKLLLEQTARELTVQFKNEETPIYIPLPGLDVYLPEYLEFPYTYQKQYIVQVKFEPPEQNLGVDIGELSGIIPAWYEPPDNWYITMTVHEKIDTSIKLLITGNFKITSFKIESQHIQFGLEMSGYN